MRLRAYLTEKRLANALEMDAIDGQVQTLIDEAVEFAKQAPYPDPSEVFENVYA